MIKNLLLLTFVMFVSFAWAQTPTPAQPEPQTQVTPAPPAPTTPGTAQEAETNPVMQNMSWMVGNWHGTGTQNGQTFESDLRIQPQLDGQALLIERSSPTGYKELMVVAYDKTSQKTVSTIFTSQNNSGIFIGNVTPEQVTLTQANSGQGAVSERLLQKTPEGQLKLTIRGGNAGEEPKTLLEMTFTKS